MTAWLESMTCLQPPPSLEEEKLVWGCNLVEAQIGASTRTHRWRCSKYGILVAISKSIIDIDLLVTCIQTIYYPGLRYDILLNVQKPLQVPSPNYTPLD